MATAASLLLVAVACSSGGAGTPTPAAATPTAASATVAPTTTPEPTIGPPEQADLKVGIWLPNMGSIAPLQVGIDRGYWKDLGLNVSFVVVADTRAAVVGGSVDIGILDISSTAQAIGEGLDVKVLGTWRCRRTYTYAVRPEIKTVADLSGKDMVIESVAGDPDANVRKALLKEKGWDLASVNPPPNYVIVPGFSNAWTKLFVAGTLAGMPVYPQTRLATLNAGGQLLIDFLSDWPNDVMFAESGWIAGHPNTAALFLRGLMRTLQDTLDVSQQVAILGLLKAAGNPVENEEKSLAANPKFLVLNQQSYCGNLALDETKTTELVKLMGLDPAPTWDKLADIGPLGAAQTSMGLTNALPPPPE